MLVSKALLLAHTLAAAVLTGSATHLALQSLAARRDRAAPRLLRLYPRVALAAWTLTMVLGSVLYPNYRVHVRAAWLDAHARWASILFDIKENLAVFVGPLLLCAALLATRSERPLKNWFAVVCWIAAGVIWWNVLSGLLVVSMRSV